MGRGAKVDKDKLRRWLCEEKRLPAPVELKIGDVVGIRLDQLSRKHFHRPPAQAKITNNGKTVLLSGKWKNTRPYIFGGPFDGKYVFSMIHFHWSHNNSKGSIHSVDGEKYPLEMHVVYFKAKYIYYEEAVKYDDGVVFEVHFFYIQEDINECLSPLIEKLSDVHRSGTSVAVEKYALARYVTVFMSDYYLYCGTMMDRKDKHRVTWIICRNASGVSNSQMNEFRQLLGQDGFPLITNSHKIYKIGNRKIYHVNGSDFVTEILYPHPKISLKKTEKLRIRFHFKPSNKVTKQNDNYQKKKKEVVKRNTYLKKIELDSFNKKIINEKRRIENLDEKQYTHSDFGRKNIIESVVQWLRNSVAQNREELTPLYETTEGCSLEKDSTAGVKSMNIQGIITAEQNKVHGVEKNKRRWSEDYSMELTPSLKPIDFLPLDSSPHDCNSIFKKGIKKKTYKKNKVKLFSDLDSNFTQQFMNKKKVNNDGVPEVYLNDNISLYGKSIDTNKKKMAEINSKEYITLERHNKKDNENDEKQGECEDHAQSTETLTKNLLKGFKNIYLKYKHDFDNRNSLNKINKTELENVNNKECGSGTKELSEDLMAEFVNDNEKIYKRENNFKTEKLDKEGINCNDSDFSSISHRNNSDEESKNLVPELYYLEQQDEKRKLGSKHKNVNKNIDILTPLKLDLDLLPKNFKDINDLRRQKLKLRKKSSQRLSTVGIIQTDSMRKKHKRTQTLKISKSSSSEPKNIIYISNRPRKLDMFPRERDKNRKKRVKFEKRVKTYSNHRVKKWSHLKINAQYNKSGNKYSNLKTNPQYNTIPINPYKSKNKEKKHPFGKVKVKRTSSHESVYIFLKRSVKETNKKKNGILYEWLLSAKDLIRGPKP